MASLLTGFAGQGIIMPRMYEPETGSRIIATVNRNSALVQAILQWRAPDVRGHPDGLSGFGVAVLTGVGPRIGLIARSVRGRDFAGRNANLNPLITGPVSPEELDRRIRQNLRSLGYDID
jgi:hypothetical protein